MIKRKIYKDENGKDVPLIPLGSVVYVTDIGYSYNYYNFAFQHFGLTKDNAKNLFTRHDFPCLTNTDFSNTIRESGKCFFVIKDYAYHSTDEGAIVVLLESYDNPNNFLVYAYDVISNQTTSIDHRPNFKLMKKDIIIRTIKDIRK